MADFHFLEPMWLWMFLPVFLVLGYLRLRASRQHNNAGQGIIAEHLAVHFRSESSNKLNLLPLYSAAVISTLMILAMSQPVWRQAVNDGDQGAPLLIVMDESQSMNRTDIAPSRDARAHLLINGLLDKGLNRPVGLLATAGSSHVLLPPSIDMEIVKLYLSYLSPEVMPVDGGDLASLAQVLADTPGLVSAGTSILLVTDGMESGISDLQQFLKTRDIPISTLAFTAMGEQTGKQLGGAVINGDKLTPENNALFNQIEQTTASGKGSNQVWVDEYRWFVIPAALLMLLWFRRGVTLYWAPVCLAMFLVSTPNTSKADVIDWFFTPDQQGMLLLKMSRYEQASERFTDPSWKAIACYYAEDWDCAQEEFGKVPTEAGVYNMATAAAQAGSYKLARDIYALLLTIDPDYPDAQNNFEIVARIVKEIEEMSESQVSEKPPQQDELEDQEASNTDDRAGGAEKQMIGKRPVKTLTADELLKSKEKTDKWLRDISRDPKTFISAKFQYEYAKSQGTVDGS
jgi:Ca-activated chloride channel family protein